MTDVAQATFSERANGAITPEGGDDRLQNVEPQTVAGRRQFLGVLAAGAVAGVGNTGVVDAQEMPVVSMRNEYFDPIGLSVEPGTTVRFDLETGSHSATAYPERIPAEAVPFDSGVISAGGFEHTFDEPGTYDYYCIPHKSMGIVGRIVVGDPGGPAEETPIPDGEVPEKGFEFYLGPYTNYGTGPSLCR